MAQPAAVGKASVRNMTEGSPVSLILRFALPIFISQVFQQLYSTADVYIVGKFLGTNAFAAVSSSGTLIMLLTSLFIGTSMGAGVAISKYFGAGDYESVSRAIHTNLAFGIVSGAALTLVGVLLTPTFLVWMNTDAQVMPEAVEYFRYYFLGVLATVLYNMCASALNALGDSRRPLHYLIISSLTNIALDLLFIGAFHWGVWAAAVATVISQTVSFVLCLRHLLRKGEVYTVTPRNIRLHGDMLREIVRYGLPSGIQNCVIGLANVIVQSQINSFGMLAMAAYGAHTKVEGFAFLPITSFTMACTTFVGQNLGMYIARRKGGADEVRLRVSGCGHIVTVQVDLKAGTARAEMPCPRSVARVTAGGHEGTLVDLGGIAHFVVEGVAPDEDFFRAAESVFAGIPALDACGVIFLDAEKRRMTPLVKVIETGSLVWEGSCGSGSVACAVAQSERIMNGGFSCEYAQPAGRVRASVERQNGQVIAAHIGGLVTLDEPTVITLGEG